MKDKYRHIEHGRIVCNPGGSSKTVVKKFDKEYDEPPVVHYSVAKINGVTHGDDAYYELSPPVATKQSFTITCKSEYGGKPDEIWIFWISFPQ